MSSLEFDPAKLKVVELRTELGKRGLDIKGNKPALVKRLKDALEEELKQEIPDTSIADTSTEDLDTSQSQDPASADEEIPEKPSESEPVPDEPNTTNPAPEKEPEEVIAEAKPLEKAPDLPEPATVEPPVTAEASLDTQDAVKASPNQDAAEATPNQEPEELDSKQIVAENQSNDDKENGDEDGEPKSKKSRWSDDVPAEVEKPAEDELSQSGTSEAQAPSPAPPPPQERSKSPIKEDEPPLDSNKVQLSWYDSDLHLQLDKESFLSAKPLHEGAFGFAWAGARATHGVNAGKACFEVKITEELHWEDFSKQSHKHRHQDKSSHQHRKPHDDSKEDSVKKNGDKTENTKPENQENATETPNTEDSEPKTTPEAPETTADDPKIDTQIEDKTTEETPTETPKIEDESSKEEKMEVETAKEDEGVEEPKTEETTSTNEEEKMEVEDAPKKEDETTEEPKKEDETTEEPKTEDAASTEEPKKEDENTGEPKSEDPDLKKEDTTEKPEEGATIEAVPEEPLATHLLRVGWSLQGSDLQLGEGEFSFGYESTGKFVSNKQFQDYGITFTVGDVVGSFLEIDDEFVSITYTVNGVVQPEALKIEKSTLPENFVFFPHVLSRNFAFELNLGDREEPWFPKPEELSSFDFLEAVPEKVLGPVRPEARSECEVILMCGLPASGKTQWVQKHVETETATKYTVLGNNQLLKRMTISGDDLKTKYKGSWSVMLDKLQRSINKLVDVAALRRRNYIIDQANVFATPQRRKLRLFEGFKRKAVVVVVSDEEQVKRQASQLEELGGKEVPDSAVMEMKANMSLPQKGDWLDEVVFAELGEEEAKATVQKYNTAGREAGYGTRKSNNRGDDRRTWQNRHNRDGNNYRDNRHYQPRYDRGMHRPNWHQRPGGWNRDRRDSREPQREWRNRGRDRNVRDNQTSHYNRNRNDSSRNSSGSWQSGGNNWNQNNWNQGGWNNPAWSNQNQNWGQSQGGWNQNQNNQWKYGGGGGGSGTSGGGNQNYGNYGSNWNYYGQYPQQDWSSQNQAAVTGSASGGNSNQYGQYSQQEWAQYAQQYAQGQNTAPQTSPPK